MVVAELLAEHELAAVGQLPQGNEIVPVKAFDTAAERRIAEGNFRLLDRAWKDHIEADHLGAAVSDTPEHAADLAGPGLRRRSLEGRCVVGFSVNGHHDDRRCRSIAAVADELAAQGREDVERETLQRLKWRGREDGARNKRNQDRHNHVPPADPPHRAVAGRLFEPQQAAYNGRRGAVALASTWKA